MPTHSFYPCLSSSYYNKIQQTRWLKEQTLISQWFWRLANSRSRFWEILCLWSEPASWLVDGHLLAVCSHAFFLEHMQGEGRRGSKLSGVPSYKGTNPILRGPPSWPHLNLVTSQRPLLQVPSHWRAGLQHTDLGEGHRHSVHDNQPALRAYSLLDMDIDRPVILPWTRQTRCLLELTAQCFGVGGEREQTSEPMNN